MATKPYWDDYWLEKAKVTLWDAICLTMNLEPSEYDPNYNPHQPYYRGKSEPPEELYKRLAIAQDYVGPDGPIKLITPSGGGSGHRDSPINLPSFARWTKSTRWKNLPDELSIIAERYTDEDPNKTIDDLKAKLQQANDHNKALIEDRDQLAKELEESRQRGPDTEATENGISIRLPHITKNLKVLFEVMRHNWRDYNPDRAPSQIGIAREIDQAIGWNSQKNGNPSRNGQTLAALIRPEHFSEADTRIRKR